jgi:hypothetical protein
VWLIQSLEKYRSTNSTAAVIFLHDHRFAGAQEAANARVDRADGAASVPRARVRPRPRGRDRSRGRRLREDRLQLLPAQGGPRLLPARGLRGGAAGRRPRPCRRRVRARRVQPVRAPAPGAPGRARPRGGRAAGGPDAHDHREREIFERYTDSLARLLAEETGAAPDDVEPRVVATALMGVHRALVDFTRRRIVAAERNPRLHRRVRAQGRRALETLGRGLEGYGERR